LLSTNTLKDESERKDSGQNKSVYNIETASKEVIVEKETMPKENIREKETVSSGKDKVPNSVVEGNSKDIFALIEKACKHKAGNNIMLYLSDRNLALEPYLLEIMHESQEKNTIKTAKKGLVLYIIYTYSVI
jgi:hypothetical protein